MKKLEKEYSDQRKKEQEEMVELRVSFTEIKLSNPPILTYFLPTASSKRKPSPEKANRTARGRKL